MEHEASWLTKSSISLAEELRERLAGLDTASDGGAIRLITASAQNWPELTPLDAGEAMLGEDGLVRIALWRASKCCATLMTARRAILLLREGAGAVEIRCLVLANASLATRRPLSGFLLKPVALHRGRVARSTRQAGSASAPEAIQDREGETRLALFDVFPVDDDGENTLPGGDLPPGSARTDPTGCSGALRIGPLGISYPPADTSTQTERNSQ